MMIYKTTTDRPVTNSFELPTPQAKEDVYAQICS
jgi:hypothetical protein